MKTCAQCQREFEPRNSMQTVCSPACAMRSARASRKAGAKSIRERKAALKTIPDLIKEAQAAFNTFVRLRDYGKPCICCGLPLADSQGVRGQGYDCGHYRSVGSAKHLRFDERNAHGQRKQCNLYGAGRAVDYRRGLVVRIGLAAVEALEADNTVHKWTRDELIAIRETYKRKAKELKCDFM